MGSNQKAGLFNAATEAYENGDLLALQIIVLQDYVEDVDTLEPQDKQFLISEYEAMVEVENAIWKKAAETTVAAAEISQMSMSRFETEIHNNIVYMRSELTRRGANPESPQRPSLREGRV